MRTRNFMITCYKKEPIFNAEKMQYMVYQQEKCPSTKKLHWQGYVEFINKYSMKCVKTIFDDNTIHVEVRKGNQKQAIDYCTKSETKVEEAKVYGKPKMQGGRSDLDAICDAIESGMTSKEILREFKGNALKHFNMIKNGIMAEWDCCPMDKMILADRAAKNTIKYELEQANSLETNFNEKCPEVSGNTDAHNLDKDYILEDEKNKIVKIIKKINKKVK